MNAWCLGARRRPTHDGGSDGDAERTKAHASASSRREAGDHPPEHVHASYARDGFKDEKHELEHRRGTRRARLCIVLMCVVLLALAMTRPMYAPYIDVFESRDEKTAAATSSSAPPPPPTTTTTDEGRSGRGEEKHRKFGWFG
ncbi:hypothetical protein BE221DRAFT_167011 [Ostreococcus tauri]|uniref:Transmembrane protein n=1 Tax=Ostreococcus tauri TaxID=70448 RepID=A0A1Y5IBD1_OSTTA|nr:hypothetical protein BE221DRAFT_167011 [Ostreococcus tauri]